MKKKCRYMKATDFLLKMEHPISILCENGDKQDNSADFGSETDPLEEIGAGSALTTKPRFYKMNSIVFAEPLKNMVIEENSSKDETEITIIENVIVHKKIGKKYKKYQFNIQDSSSTRCAQLNCLRTFPTKTHLISHIRRVHCADHQRYICEQCGRGFPERHMLRRHAHTHSDETVECPVCGVKLRLRTSLATHLRSHSNLRPHECDICKKTFARASSKAIHIKFVHREGLLDCGDCDKRFASRKQWSLHMKIHREKKT